MGSSRAGGVTKALIPPSKRLGNEGALGVQSRGNLERPAVEEWEVVVVVGLSLLEIGPSTESSSDSISITFSQENRAGDAWATVRGTATARVEGVGEGMGARGARTPRHPSTASQDTSQLGPFFLIQNHPRVQIS